MRNYNILFLPRALLLSDQTTRELQEAVEEGEGELAVRLKDLSHVWFAGAPLINVYIFFITHIS